MENLEKELLAKINEQPGIPRVKLCEMFGMWTKINLGMLLHKNLVTMTATDSKILTFEITRKGRLVLETCSSCECNPCDCNWGTE